MASSLYGNEVTQSVSSSELDEEELDEEEDFFSDLTNSSVEDLTLLELDELDELLLDCISILGKFHSSFCYCILGGSGKNVLRAKSNYSIRNFSSCIARMFSSCA